MATNLLLTATSNAYGRPLFKALLSVHILAAMVWLGGGVALAVLGQMAGSRDDLATAVADARRAARLRARLFLPASVVLLGCGFGLVAVGGFTLHDLWIDLALGGWLVSLGISTGYLLPATDELSEQATTLGPEATSVASLLGRIRIVGAVESLLLLAVVFDMVFRP